MREQFQHTLQSVKLSENEDIVLLTVNDVQSILKCGKQTVYDLFNSRTFPSFHIGRRKYVTAKALANWIKRHEEICAR